MSKFPYKFTKVKRQNYLDLLDSGVRRLKAARAVGVDPKTVERAAEDDPEFARQRDLAEGRATDEVEEAMYQAAISGNTTAGFRWLERMRPEIWKEQERPLPGSSPETPLYIAPGQVDWDNLPDDLAEEVLSLHRKILALQPQSGGFVLEEPEDGAIEVEYRMEENVVPD